MTPSPCPRGSSSAQGCLRSRRRVPGMRTKEMIYEWEKRISRKDWKLKPTHTVCELHFEKECIIELHDVAIDGSNKRLKKALTKNAIPTIFEGYPSYKNKPEPKKRKSPSKRGSDQGNTVGKKRKRNEEPRNLETIFEEIESEQRESSALEVDADKDSSEATMSGPPSLWDAVFEKPELIKRPSCDWHIYRGPNFMSYVHIAEDIQIDRFVKIIRGETGPQVFAMQRPFSNFSLPSTLEDLQSLINRVDRFSCCPGTGVENIRAPNCPGLRESDRHGRPPPRCHACAEKKKTIAKGMRRKLAAKYNRKRKQTAKTQHIKSMKQKILRRDTKIVTLKEKVEALAVKCSELERQAVLDYVSKMPPRWQLAILTCVECSKAKTPNGRRYTVQWIYECQLLRIKSLALYKKMLRDNFLPLPSIRTLQRYMKKLSPQYGFQKNVFEMLKEKAPHMEEAERHGALLIDEIKISERIWFDKPSLNFQGFVNLDEYTPEQQKDVPADHVLVAMFQGFKGQYQQTLSAHLGKGAVQGPILAKLVIEMVRLVEDAGFFIDAVVSDAASWNRRMWSEFGLTKKHYEKQASKKRYEVDDNDDDEDENFEYELAFLTNRPRQQKTKKQRKRPNNRKAKTRSLSPAPEENDTNSASCTHPIDGKGRLWFVSDFPHLIKSIKQRVLNAEELETPDGKVKLNHWVIVFKEDEKRGIKVAPKLSNQHFLSESYIVMNVGLSFSFFSEQVASAMIHYKNMGVKGLEDCDATVKFIRRMNVLIERMNANTRRDSIQAEDITEESAVELPPVCIACQLVHEENTPQRRKSSREVIQDFLEYLEKWETSGVTRDKRLTASAAYGLRVTSTTALEVSSYLIKELNFEYFMTRRLNQDALEHFFGEIRQGCGAHGHPDPAQFIQVFRLLMFKNLVKPPRGSNITGGESLKALLSMPDVESESNQKQRLKLERELDEALNTGEVIDGFFSDHTYYESLTVDQGALRFFGGYVARRARKISCARTCKQCFDCLEAPNNQPLRADDDLIHGRSQGFLLIPSDPLVDLLEQLEISILEVFQLTHLHKDLLFEVTAQVKSKNIAERKIGCDIHSDELTKAVMSFFLCTRMIFACEEYSKKFSENAKKKTKSKQQQKLFRLTC